MTVYYEWDVETVTKDEFEDIENHAHQKSYADCVAFAATEPPEGFFYRIVLVRDDDDRRAWAYLKDGKLPEYFSDADGRDYRKAPKRFVLEVVIGSPPPVPPRARP